MDVFCFLSGYNLKLNFLFNNNIYNYIFIKLDYCLAKFCSRIFLPFFLILLGCLDICKKLDTLLSTLTLFKTKPCEYPASSQYKQSNKCGNCVCLLTRDTHGTLLVSSWWSILSCLEVDHISKLTVEGWCNPNLGNNDLYKMNIGIYLSPVLWCPASVVHGFIKGNGNFASNKCSDIM